MGKGRTISVGLSRLFRLVETPDTETDGGPREVGYRIEQAVKTIQPATAGNGHHHEWKWVPLAFATHWGEAHGALHQMQADFLDKMIERQGSFRGDRPIR